MDEFKKSPFVTLWIHPRETIRKVIHTTSTKTLLLLLLVGMLVNILDQASTYEVGQKFPIENILLGSLLLTPVMALVSYWGYTWVLWIGLKMFKTNISFKELRTAMAWSFLPIVWFAPVVILKILIFGSRAFTTLGSAGYLEAIFQIADLVLAVWGVVIYFAVISEVGKLRIWKILVATIFAFITLVFVAFFFFFFFALFMSSSDSLKFVEQILH